MILNLYLKISFSKNENFSNEQRFFPLRNEGKSAFDIASITLCLARTVAHITPFLIPQNRSAVLMETPPDGFTCRSWPAYAGRRPQTEINFENVADKATVAKPQLPVQCVFDCPLSSTSSLLFSAAKSHYQAIGQAAKAISPKHI